MLSAPRSRNGLYEGLAREGIGVRSQDRDGIEQGKRSTAACCSLEPCEVIEQEDAARLRPLVLRATATAGIERIDAARAIGRSFACLIEERDDREETTE